jgi:hypothetical protein
MAKIEFSAIPREFETTRRFEAQDVSESELKALRERISGGADIEADARTVLGRNLDLPDLRFLQVSWGRFGQFVQDLAFRPIEGDAPSDAPIIKEEIVTRYRTSKG